MKLVVISPPQPIQGEAKIVSGMMSAGLEHFHLRKPEAPLSYFQQYLQELSSAERRKVVIHSNHELVPSLGLKVMALPDNKTHA